MFLTDRVELRDGGKAIDGPKEDRNKPSHPVLLSQKTNISHLPLTIMLRILWDGCYCNKRLHNMLSHQYISYL